jgi:hypothetical protein
MLEEIKALPFQLSARRQGRRTRPASRDLLEIGIFDFQRHGPSKQSGALAAAPDLVHDRLQRVARRIKGEEVGGKGVLRADRLPDPIGANRPFVDPTRDPVIVWP